jgi:hypothetical protein
MEDEGDGTEHGAGGEMEEGGSKGLEESACPSEAARLSRRKWDA